MRGKKGPTILEQLISVDYHEKPTYDHLDDIDLVSSGISVVRDVRAPSEQSVDPNHEPVTDKISSEGSNKISSGGSETPLEHLYDDPATDSS